MYFFLWLIKKFYLHVNVENDFSPSKCLSYMCIFILDAFRKSRNVNVSNLPSPLFIRMTEIKLNKHNSSSFLLPFFPSFFLYASLSFLSSISLLFGFSFYRVKWSNTCKTTIIMKVMRRLFLLFLVIITLVITVIF